MNRAYAAIGFLLLSFQCGFAQNSQISVPAFFFRDPNLADSELGFILETPELRASFRQDSVEFHVHGARTVLKFSGARRDVRVDGERAMAGKVNFFLGPDTRTEIETYSRIRYRELYPGIDLTYAVTDNRIKSEFVLAPGADPGKIRLAYQGADRISVGPDGELIVQMESGELRENAPLILQNGQRIEGRYRLVDRNTVGFEIGGYDRSKPLVIDPTISYSTYLGGSSMGALTGVAVDSAGNVYLAGWTEALNFPIAGAYQASNASGVDAVVLKLNPTGTSLIYATYLGGNSDDRATAIAVDSSGNAYITGSTASTNFPVVSSLRSKLGGSRDAFVAKLNPSGNSLVYSTLLGGSNNDWGYAIAVDASGNAYVAGDTLSTDFPILSAAQVTEAGNMDAFVTKLSPSCTIVFSTYLGGSGNEHTGGIAIDTGGNV